MPEYRIVEVTPHTAALVPPAFARAVGYTYFDAGMYQPESVAAAVSAGRLLAFVAADRDGEARGYIGLRFRFPGPGLAEVGPILIDPAVGTAASGQILRALTGTVATAVRPLARQRGLRALVSLDATWHQLTQRLVGHLDFVSTGLFLAWQPAWGERVRMPVHQRPRVGLVAPRTDLGRTGRRSETVSVRPFRSLCEPYTVTAPHRFRAALDMVYKDLRLPVSFAAGSRAAGASEITESVDPGCGRAVVELVTAGADAAEALLGRLHHYRDGMLDVIHVVLPLAGADVGPAADALADAGCRYAAVLPCYRGHDALVLQYLNGVSAELSEADLVSPAARTLLREVIEPSRVRPMALAGPAAETPW